MRWIAHVAGVVMAAVALAPAHALEEDQDVWSFFVGGSASYDDNFLRLPNGVQPVEVGVGNRPRGTWIYTAYARVLMSVPVSRQRFRLDLTGYSNRYADYSYLDFNSWNGRADWLWEVGNRWKGVAFIARNESLTSFADFRDFNTGNILTAYNAYVDADYWIHPNWRIVGAANYRARPATVSHPRLRQPRPVLVEAGVPYVSTAQNWLAPDVPVYPRRVSRTARCADAGSPTRASTNTTSASICSGDSRRFRDHRESRLYRTPAAESRPATSVDRPAG